MGDSFGRGRRVVLDNWIGRGKVSGSWPSTSGTWMHYGGYLGQMAMYAKPLSPKAVAAHYDAGIGYSSGYIPAGTHKLRIEYQELTGNAKLRITTAGVTIKPRYDLVTSVIDPDGRRTNTTYTYPELGLAATSVVDPAGLALTTTTDYETAGANKYFRRIGRTLPAGNSWAYEYYGTGAVPATADDPCTAGTQSIHQGGGLWKRTGPDPDGGGSGVARVDETVYDVKGRVRATRVGSGSWTCITYDARNRVASVAYPAFGGKSARTVTTSYYVYGGSSPVTSPLVGKVSDPAGDIMTVVDWSGRTVSYTDVWGKTTTTTYDAAGRVSQSVGPAGTLEPSYDGKNRLSLFKVDSTTVATPSYHSGSGLMTGVAYNNGSNGAIGFDTRGRLNSLGWTGPSSALITTDAVTRSLAGNVSNETIDGGSPDNTYTYDNAGRLTGAVIGATTYGYNYAATGGCGTLTTAGKNTNRTSLTVNGSPTATYCYDNADRLTSTTASGIGTLAYDAQGNTTTIAGETHTYDAANRHLDTSKSGTTVTYTRDALDRIVARTDGTTTTRYSFSADGDAPVATLNTSNTVIERTIPLPGGVLLTKRSGGDVWSYPNIHGDVVAVTNSSATIISTHAYDPFGNSVAATPDNSASDFDYAWLGQHQRPLERNSTLTPMIEMGARQYSPQLGRFLESDPVEGGTASNDFAYLGDPVNKTDLTGQWWIFDDIGRGMASAFGWLDRFIQKHHKGILKAIAIVGFIAIALGTAGVGIGLVAAQGTMWATVGSILSGAGMAFNYAALGLTVADSWATCNGGALVDCYEDMAMALFFNAIGTYYLFANSAWLAFFMDWLGFGYDQLYQ